MGNAIRTLLSPLRNYPIKRKPICFYIQQDFTITGEPVATQLEEEEGNKMAEQAEEEKVDEEAEIPGEGVDVLREYNELVNDFHKALLNRRQEIRKQTVQEWHVQMVKSRFSGWDSITVAYLHSLFLLFDQAKQGSLSLSEFCTLLESLGDKSPMEERRQRFNNNDEDMDGRITSDQYLSLMYNFNPSRLGILGRLASLCYEAAHKAEFVDSLTTGEQMMYGLF